MTHDLTPRHDVGEGAGPTLGDGDASAWDLDGVLATRRGEGNAPEGEPDGERDDVPDGDQEAVLPADPEAAHDAGQDGVPATQVEVPADQDGVPADQVEVPAEDDAAVDGEPDVAHEADQATDSLDTASDEDLEPGAEATDSDEQLATAVELGPAGEVSPPTDESEPAGESMPADETESTAEEDQSTVGPEAHGEDSAAADAHVASADGDDEAAAPADGDDEAAAPADADDEAAAPADADAADAAEVAVPVDGPDELPTSSESTLPADRPDGVEPSPPGEPVDPAAVQEPVDRSGGADGVPEPDGANAPWAEPDVPTAEPAAAPENEPAAPPATQLHSSPLDQFEAEPESPRRRRGLVITLIVLLVLGGAYAAAALLLGDRLPNGTTVAGVPIGGLSEADARARLDTDLAAAQAELIPVTLQGEAVSAVDPATVGLALDVDATLDPLLGPAFDPRILWGRVFGAAAVPVVSTVDEDALREALETSAGELDISPVEGFITFAGTTPEVTDPVPGTAVDIDAAQELLTREWLTAERPLELPSQEVAPTVGAEAVQEALTTQAQPLVSGPVSVSVDGNAVELTPENLAANAVFVATDGALDRELDGAGLSEAVVAADPEVEVAGTDAEIILNANAEPQIVPSTSGMGLDPTDLAAAVETAGTSTDRTAVVELVEAEPEFTTADAEALGVKEIVADFSTPMPYDPVRTENLVVGSRYVTGVLVKPGEEFSLLKALGPIVGDRGFVSSGVVEDGFSSTALGGGLSQLSTNMFNVGLIAGMDDVEHTPHSRWFQRYPAGREATLWEPSKDMIWRNNTDYGVLVHAWVADGRVHTRLWSTKVWDVEITTSGHYNITQPDTKYNPREDCVAESGGQYGFTVTVTRERSREGAPPESQDWTWTYQPWHRIVCGEPPSAQPTPTDTPPEGEPAPEDAA